ncbi:MAG: type II toxin-antitoxin system VapC family toxin [Candidatus Hydrogenedentes bacterium]|nr:type II toxin-antitoxin system VapC family toxin [Candidatus Hydrogenedentota bacterium]
MILADTDILIDVSRRYRPSIEAVEELRSDESILVSVVSQMELTIGCRDAREKRAVDELLAEFGLIPISEPASILAAALVRDFYLSRGLLIPDALIAATAISHGYRLLTRNRRHFDFVPGLQLLPFE